MENTPKNILLVDDDQGFLAMLAGELRDFNNNFSILTAENGNKALKVLESAHVDLVVTDLNMPVMNGYDLLSHMKKKYPNIPVIVISGFLYPGLEATLRTLGASQSLDKPSLSVNALGEMILKRWQGIQVEEKGGEEGATSTGLDFVNS